MNLKRFQVGPIAVVSILMAVMAEPVAAQNRNDLSIPTANRLASGDVVRVESGTWLQASIAGSKPWKRVSKGSVLEGCLSLPIYSGDKVAVPAGTKLRLIVDSVTKGNDGAGKWKKLGRGLLRAFNPSDTRPAAQYIVQTSAVEAILADGSSLPLKTHVLRVADRIRILPEIHDLGKEGRPQLSERPRQRRAKPERTVLLRLDAGIAWPIAKSSTVFDNEQRKTPSTNRARAFLLTALSASQSKEGDLFQAQLAEPVRLAGQMFGAGSLLEGSVVRTRAPRILSRAGSLRLRVHQVTSQQGQVLAVKGTLVGAEANGQTRVELDDEGGLRGLKSGLKNALLDLGMTYAFGKVADDVSETPVRAIGMGIGDAAVANAARYVGLGTSALFLVTRRGRDVYLPRYAEITIDFGRLGGEPSVAPIETMGNEPCDFEWSSTRGRPPLHPSGSSE